METFLIDFVVNNTYKSKKTVKKQLTNLEFVFGESFKLEITPEVLSQRKQVIDGYKKILVKLLNLPKVEQRSEEWYCIRKNLITASDFAQALGKGKFGSVNQFLKSKCGYEVNNVDMTIPALKWGVRYEEVANMFYKQKLNVEVYEFGVLKHPTIDFIGASPDGISDMGVMLEIKCPWKRKKTETIPEQYFYQIQGQLEVCDLEECDYLECYIQEYDDRDAMKECKTCLYKGVIYEVKSNIFEHGALHDLDHERMEDTYINVYYYGIKDYFLRRVYRDKEFFRVTVSEIEKVWMKVLEYRSNEALYRGAVKTTARTKRKPVFMFRECQGDTI
jgi:putative phage-type endonuclease